MASDEGATRAVIADDHPPQRLGVKSVLEGAGFEVAGEASDARGAVEAAVREQPDVCLLDVHMPGGGIAACEQILREVPDTTVVMLTVSEEDEDLFAALRAGAAGYLLKDMNPSRLPEALRGVLAGEAALPRTLMNRVMEEFSGRNRRRLSLRKQRTVELSQREWEVLDMLRRGLTTAQIAQEMGVSPVTVRVHISAMLKKLKVTSRDEAVKLLEE